MAGKRTPPATAVDPGKGPSTLELVSEAVKALEHDPEDLDVRPVVAGAIATLAVKLDALEATLGELRELITSIHLDAVDRTTPLDFELGEVQYAEGIEARVRELEQRTDEAGRRMLFASERRPGGMTPAPHWIADVGRALLFDTETPNEPVETTAAVEGTAEVTKLGDPNANT